MVKIESFWGQNDVISPKFCEKKNVKNFFKNSHKNFSRGYHRRFCLKMSLGGSKSTKWAFFGVFRYFLVKIPIQRLFCKNIWHYPPSYHLDGPKCGFPNSLGSPSDKKHSGNMRPLRFLCTRKSRLAIDTRLLG